MAATLALTSALLADVPGYFILTGGHPATAKDLAQTLKAGQGLPMAEALPGLQLPPAGSVRRLLSEFWQADGQPDYSLICPTLPPADWSLTTTFTFYNEPTTLEAFFAQARHVFNTQSMRSRQFNAIFAFLRCVFLTHKVLVCAKHAHWADSHFAQATTRQVF